jgi:uncharacterized repeat protein (TIGR03803 family)
MRRKIFGIAAGCIVGAVGLLPVFSSSLALASTERILYSFTGGSDGGKPLADLTIDRVGNLYGTTSSGGTGTACSGGCGTVFELTHSGNGWKEQVLYSFAGGTDGARPAAGMIFDSSGTLYGTTAQGGTNGGGTVFKLSPRAHGGWTEKILYNFTCQSDGCTPQTDLVFDAQGDLFGTTSVGGTGGNLCNNNGCGTVFELIPQANGSWKEATIHEFTGAPDGGQPSSAVVLDSLGNVYGMTEFGGTGKCEYSPNYLGCGIVYELTPNSGGGWTQTVIDDFVRGGGFAVNPSGGLILDSAGGHLLGTSLAGGDGLGTVFDLKQLQKGWEQSVLNRFYGNPDGSFPVGKVEVNTDGVLFGVTSFGGVNKAGTVFELKRSATEGWVERVLYSFVTESNPRAGVVSGLRGHLYGTTSSGGTGNFGTVYEVTP